MRPLATLLVIPMPFAVLLAFTAPLVAQVPPDSVGRLIDLWGLPHLEPGVTCRQLASTDPAGRGEDHGHFLRREGDRCVLAELNGPGVIARLWSANAAGRLRIFLDGEDAPRIDCPFQDLFTGKYPPFVPPIAVHAGGGWISYFPIPYAKSCRVEVTELHDPAALYYHVQYVTYPPGTALRTFTRELPASEQKALQDVLLHWERRRMPASPPPGTKGELRDDAPATGSVPPDGTFVILDEDGPGAVLQLRIQPESPSPEVLRGLVLEACWDGATEPSIEAPLGDFFGVGFGVTPWKSLVLGWDATGGYCSFVMPFHRHARIVVHNTLAQPVKLRLAQALRWHGEPVANAGCLHAEFRATDRVGDELYEWANVAGPGKLLGLVQALQGVGDLWYLEGNEEITVDGEQHPSIVGTGTEDFYDGGWYWDGGTFAEPLHGLNVKSEWKTNRTIPYRFFVPDAIPFSKHIAARIEHGSSNEVRDAYYSSVAFWYGPPRAVRKPSPDELRPPRQWVFVQKGWTAASTLEFSTGVERRAFEDFTDRFRGLDHPLFQAFPVSYVQRDQPKLDARAVLFPASAKPTRCEATFTVPFADRFRLDLRMIGSSAAPTVGVHVDGKRIGEVAMQTDISGPLDPASLGPISLTKGTHHLTFEAPAQRGPCGIFALRLEPASHYVRTWRIGPPIAANRKGTVEDAMPQEAELTTKDFDPARAGWKQIDAKGDGLDLNHEVSSKAPVLGYLAFAVKTEAPRTVHVLLGSDDGVRVWVNGQLAWSHAIHRPMTPDEDQFDVPLAAGWNRFLVKVKNDDGGYGVMVRIADVDGTLAIAADPQ